MKCRTHWKFGQCLDQNQLPFKSSHNSFGEDAFVSGSGVVSTPLITKQLVPYYWLTLEAITIGNVRVPLTRLGDEIRQHGNRLWNRTPRPIEKFVCQCGGRDCQASGCKAIRKGQEANIEGGEVCYLLGYNYMYFLCTDKLFSLDTQQIGRDYLHKVLQQLDFYTVVLCLESIVQVVLKLVFCGTYHVS